MTAKHKLNSAHFTGAIIFGALFGALTGSWLVFLIVAGLIIVTGLHDGSIRL